MVDFELRSLIADSASVSISRFGLFFEFLPDWAPQVFAVVCIRVFLS